MYALHMCFYFRTQRWQPSDNTKALFNTHEGSSLSFGCCASFFFSALPRRPNGPGTTRRLAPRPAPVRPSQPEKGQNTTRTEPPMGRILYVISSFDRGQRLGKKFANKLDKLDFVLMMLDEMREACEVSAWERRCLVSGRGRRHGRARTCSNLTDFLARQRPCTVGGCQSRVLSGHIRGRRRSAS